MNKSTSLYLDFLRVIAAFGVLLVHAELPFFSNGLFFRQELGHKLVMVFFVLSGFLIAFTVDKKNKGSKQYLIDRFSRLYSVVLPAIVFTYLIDFVGQKINPAFYQGQLVHNHQFLRMLLNVAFLQQIWGLYIQPSTNGPFWSVAYEFWYYVIFWVWCYYNGSKRYIGLLVVGLIIGVKILALFPVWIFGVTAYKLSSQKPIPPNYAKLLFVVVTALILGLTFLWDFSFFPNRFVLVKPPLFFSSNFGFDWIYGFLIAVNIYCFNCIGFKFELHNSFTKAIKYLSSITFSLYLFHFPILIFVASVLHYNKSSYLQTGFILIGVVLVVNVLAIISEKQRNHFKKLFEKIFSLFTSKSV